jgi:molybdopterin converting factor small subunit
MLRIDVRLFGALRKYANGAEISLEVPSGTTVSGLRSYLGDALRRGGAAFADQPLLDASVLADEEQILDDAQALVADRISLAVLPPVCGG